MPRAPGVYRFRDGRGHVLYVGRAIDLRRRVVSYWGELGDRGHLAVMVPRVRRVEAVVCDSGHEAAWLERNLLERELPRWNRSRGGQEVPVYVCLHGDQAGPRLAVAHSVPDPGRVRCFGPYLGGTKVRTAVAALRRVFGLEELARARGVEVADPAAIAAVLGRDPAAVAAVRAELVRRREEAAARLAFEVAAQSQAEIEAVEWVLAEQKVTVRVPVDLDVYGWAGGVLIRLGIRDGRMCEWSRTRRAGRSAAALLAATPDSWRDFADRTARLAADLG